MSTPASPAPVPPIPNVRVRTERLLLRPIGDHDRAEYVRVMTISEAHFRAWHPLLPSGTTPDELFERHLRRSRAGILSGNELRLVGELDDGRIGGFFNLNQIVRGDFHSAYAGWSVSADQIGRGLCTEGMWGLLDFAFAPSPHGLALHRVQANVIPRNTPSRRVAQKLAMREEGLAIRYLRICGAWEDHVMYAKLADEHTPRYLCPQGRTDG